MQEARKYAEFDAGKAEAFAGELLSALNHGALCLMTSIGHRTGLFDAMSTLPPSTADAIAEKAGLNERYVREWLGAMVTGRVIEVDPSSGKYRFPAHSNESAGARHPEQLVRGEEVRPVGVSWREKRKED